VEADEDGFYDTQYEGDRIAGRGWQRTGPGGEYRFWSVRPTSYPVPVDGPVGELIAAAGRRPMRPAHLHLMVTAPGYRTLITHVFAAGDEYLYRTRSSGSRQPDQRVRRAPRRHRSGRNRSGRSVGEHRVRPGAGPVG